MSTNNNDQTGVKERIKQRLLQATDEESLSRIRQELRQEGEKPGTVDSCVHELRKQGNLRFTAKSAAITKALPVEALVENLPWPVDVDGNANPVFIAGMKYEAMNVIRGIRLAQELSKMDVERTAPLIKMAQELRQGEVKAAETVGRALAQVTLESNEKILAALNNLNVTAQAGSPNKFQQMLGMLQSIPQMFSAMNQLMGMFGMKPVLGQPGQPQPGQLPLAGQQPGPQPQPAPPGVQEASEVEIGEVFDE